jgi:hypothetical protein
MRKAIHLQQAATLAETRSQIVEKKSCVILGLQANKF